jgi:hypothetical protein
LSLPANKPPFIGIGHDAGTFHQANRDNGFFGLQNPKIDMILDPLPGKVFITLQLQRFDKVAWYEPAYNRHEFIEWVNGASVAKKINFGLVIRSKDGTYQVARDEFTNKPLFCPIERMFITEPSDEKVIRFSRQKP